MACRSDIENRSPGAFERLRAACRLLLLNVPDQREVAFVEWVDDQLAGLSIPQDERSAWIDRAAAAFDEAIDQQKPLLGIARHFLQIVSEAIKTKKFMIVDSIQVDIDAFSQQFSQKYIEKIKRLSRMHGSSSRQARTILWYAPEVVRLYAAGVSISEITRRSESISTNFPLTMAVINSILSGLQLDSVLSSRDFALLLSDDDVAQDWRLADADLIQAIDIVAEQANDIGYPGNLRAHLAALLTDSSAHPPLALILHFQLATIEFRDHAPTFGYEFRPRGQNATPFKDRYRMAGLMPGADPFLDNAKSVSRFDLAWAQSKENDSPATALVLILQELEGMPYPSRREVANKIRAVLMRNLTLKTESHSKDETINMLQNLSDKQLSSLVSGIVSGNTGTVGLLEQRLVDAYAAVICPEYRYKYYGFGDPVFASNRFRKKLGDCEVVSAESGLIIFGFESHGGVLTPDYVDSHMRTLEIVFQQRVSLFESICGRDEWSISVIFVAHDIDGELQPSLMVDGVEVKLGYITFRDLPEYFDKPSGKDALRRYLIDPLCQPNVRRSVREKALLLVKKF